MSTVLKGLAWDHRRATAPLRPLMAAFRKAVPEVDIRIDWHLRPLADFEHQTIAEVARQFDLLIIDHPFCGDVVEEQAFVDLADFHPVLFGDGADALYVGPSLASYRYRGGVWAAPIDGATMHAAYRADLMGGEPLPVNWTEAMALGQRLNRRGLSLGLAVHTPHAIAAMFSLMANAGRPIQTDPDGPFLLERSDLAEALGLVRRLMEHAPAEAVSWSSIDLHNAFVERDDIAYSPCVYGYATYGEPDMRRRLSFANFAGLDGASGSMLGGTGLAVSNFSNYKSEALAFAEFAASRGAQDDLVPWNHGQPAAVGAWSNPEIDAQFNGFFSGVRHSMETAWIRPRRSGYVPFQHAAGIAVERFFRGLHSETAAIDAILVAAGALEARRAG